MRFEIAVPRARLTTSEGGTAEWKSQALRAYQRRTLAADALIASTYLAAPIQGALCRIAGTLEGGDIVYELALTIQTRVDELDDIQPGPD